jgi:hypothetical protein
MYFYNRPKSAIWGHSLKKMKPARINALFSEFLVRAVAEHSIWHRTLQVFKPLTSIHVRRFEQLLGVVAPGGHFSLTPHQFEESLHEIINDDALIPDVLLMQGVAISQWLIEGQPVATDSRFLVYYCPRPCLTTWLNFETIEQFQCIRRVFEDLDFCELHEKYLKPERIRASRESRNGNGNNGA